MRRALQFAGAALVIIAMAVFVTWPQALYMSTRVASHQDPQFSIWRLAWIAHALAHDPRHLFSANVFYPSPNSLTYSDAMLFEGVLAAPLFWLNVSPATIYNVMLFTGIAGSGLAMFVLARHLTGSGSAALVAAAVFTMAPFRIEHFMHLELQWAMWIPLTFWALDRAIEDRSWRFGALTGLFLWLQIVSCVYYGVFLAIALLVAALVYAIVRPTAFVRAVPVLILGATGLTLPYMLPYLDTGRRFGLRDDSQILYYSGQVSSYFSSPPQNWLWGWTESGPEVNLFLGWTTMVLAVAAVGYRPRRRVFVFGAVAALSIDLSLGLNSRLYTWLLDHLAFLHGLRCPSRFSIVACCAVAALAAFGMLAIQQHLSSRHARAAAAVVPIVLALMLAEFRTTGMSLMNLPRSFGTVYKVMHAAGPGVVIEFPIPRADQLAGHDPDYQLWSISHWHPLINGYSGYYPPEYIDTLTRMREFPSDDTIAHLHRLDVRYVIVHCSFLRTEKGADLCTPFLLKLGARSDLHWDGKYTDPEGDAHLFLLEKERQ
jgi:hypothetical protein